MRPSIASRLGLDRVDALLCDADGNLFPSEEPAFEASAAVVNRLLVRLGASTQFTPEALRLATTGQNFRATATALAREHGVELGDELEDWVERERRRVTDHLASVLRPDLSVVAPVRALASRYRLALVSSSAAERIGACLQATGLAGLFPPGVCFSAEDSLPEPTSKPDPAIYRHSLLKLGIAPAAALAVEDSVPGVLSAVRAGVPVVGNVQFVAADERTDRERELLEAGAVAVLSSWNELARGVEASRKTTGEAMPMDTRDGALLS
jgi:beta-phosphoglucomutase-like phosphatase (HAD superfamily)